MCGMVVERVLWRGEGVVWLGCCCSCHGQGIGWVWWGGSLWAAGVVVGTGSRLCIVSGLVGWRSPYVCVSVVVDAF